MMSLRNFSMALVVLLMANATAEETTIPAMMKPLYGKLIQGVSQWGETAWSSTVAQNMMSKTGPAVEESLALTRIEKIDDRVWMIYAPIVNVVVIETDAGLVLVDAGHAPAGPAIVKVLRSVSDKPIHTVIYTHGHIDHAYGTWAFIEAGESPQIIATNDAAERMLRYVSMRGHYAKWLPQAIHQMPASVADIVLPTVTFNDEYRFTVGGEEIVLRQHRGETEGHLYAWMPGRNLVAVGDFWQGFLSNAGNGRREQRHIEEWTTALQELHDLRPNWMLPAHGKPVRGVDAIQSELSAIIEAYQYVITYTLDALEQGLDKHVIVEQFAWPERFAKDQRLQPRYNSARDMVKVLVRQYTGWWNGLPADWSPSPMQQQAETIVAFSGGRDSYLSKVRDILDHDPSLGLHMAQWARLAFPNDQEVKRVFAQALYQKGMSDDVTGMEASVYIQSLRQLMVQ